MADRSSSPSKEFVDEILKAFRRELDAHTDQLFSQQQRRSAATPTTTPSMLSSSRSNSTGRRGELGQPRNGSSVAGQRLPKRVAMDDTPRFYEDDAPDRLAYRNDARNDDEEDAVEDNDDDRRPSLLQTPFASSSSMVQPATSVQQQLRGLSPLYSSQQPSPMSTASASATWKASMNHILDTIEASNSRSAKLQEENTRLGEKVDSLARDFASLQQDYVDQQQQLQDVTAESEDLKKVVQELRHTMVENKQQWESENDELRLQLQDARKERDTVERHNDKLQDRLREYELQQDLAAATGSSSRRSRETSTTNTPNAGGGGGYERRYRAGGGGSTPSTHYGNPIRGYNNSTSTSNLAEEPPRTTTATTPGVGVGRRRYERGDSYSSRSPGEDLVRDLTEKTHLDADYLAPLSDILDRRLGRDTNTTAGTADYHHPAPPPRGGGSSTTPSRRTTNLYSS